MTAEEFKNMDWNDSHVGYDMQVGNYRTIAYLTASNKYPGCLLLVADNKDFPIRNSGCGLSSNPCPADVLEILEKHEFDRIAVIIDGVLYDLQPGIFHVNGIDSQIMFDEIPFDFLKEADKDFHEKEQDIDIEER